MVIITTFQLIYPSAIFRCFMSNLGVHIKSQTETFIWTIGTDCSTSVNHDWVQVLSYSKYYLLVLLVVGIELTTCRWFHSEAPPNKMTYPLRHASLTDSSEWILRTYKPNISITFLTIAHMATFLYQPFMGNLKLKFNTNNLHKIT